MKPTTERRYKRIRDAAARLYGTMPVMKIYLRLADDFDLSDERIRKILGKKHQKRPPPAHDWLK